ncbi:hypothetical protein GX50_05447 [[Emmonsia] crescens]|uniref:Uncharacterized protein n=1 Tax=[Emmonsia] crescens TaxID=73230 RepID=A0A2B7ZEH1_9EURO|nr:hypothetical protein GX50_05447 [Emmonsia crescens]
MLFGGLERKVSTKDPNPKQTAHRAHNCVVHLESETRYHGGDKKTEAKVED